MRKAILFILTTIFFQCISAQECEWIKTQGGSGQVNTTCNSTDPSDNTIIGGYYNPELIVESNTFNTSTIGQGYLSKYNSSGELLWAKVSEGVYSRFYNIITDKSHNIYAVGLFRDSVVFPGNVILKNPYNTTQTALFMSKFDSSGNCLWAKCIAHTNRSLGD